MAAALLILAALLVLPAIYLRDAARERRRRAGFFGEALSLFDSYRVTQRGGAWPVLEGRYRGTKVRLEPVLDDLAWRKVPSLWLKATVMAPQAGRGTFAFLMRPQGHEFFSPAADMNHRLTIPAHWPQTAIFCSDDRNPPDLDALDPHMAAFQDPRTKEMVVTPKGIRLVYQAAQAERGDYLVLRQAHFENCIADPALVRSLLDRAFAIAATLDAGARQQAA